MNTQNLGRQPYDVGTVGGIQFWLKSNAPVGVEFLLPETIAVSDEGTCADSATQWNCNNHFTFQIIAPSPDRWTKYDVPFSALAQSSKNDANGNVVAGSATWNPTQLVGVQFSVPWGAPLDPGTTYDVWIDDVSFYACPTNTCTPTCAGQAPKACPASGTRPAGCFPEGTDCSNLLGGDLYRVWGSGTDDIWAVGANLIDGTGIIRHWNGTVWSFATGDTTNHPLWNIWGSDKSDAWAVADYGIVALRNGTTWTTSTLESTTGTQARLNAVWGSAPDDVYVVASPGTILHWDGATWTTSTSIAGVNLWALWGSGPDSVWAAGDGGTILHWDGTNWSTNVTGPDGTLDSVWGSGANDVWAVGGFSNQATILHWDGTAWSLTSTGDVYLTDVWGAAHDDVWAVGVTSVSGVAAILHWNGTAWSSVAHPGAGSLNGVWGSRSNDVWAVGARGTTLHWDGFSWSVVPNGDTQ
jgi:hypothetical protein